MFGDVGRVQDAELSRDIGRSRSGHLEAIAEHADQVQSVADAGNGCLQHP